MSLHIATAGWLLGAHSGANTRLLALLRAVAPLLAPDERITVLHRPDYIPPKVHEQVHWSPLAIPAGPTWRRIATERRLLAPRLQQLGANVLDHGFLPVPEVPCPVVLTIHDLRDADGHGRRPTTLARWLLRRSVLRTHTVLVPSEFTATRLRELAPRTRIVVAHNGVELPPTPNPERDEGYLLHVGHLEARKNLAMLLHALAALPATSCPTLRLVGADAGEGRRLRELAAQLGIADRVAFLGQISDDAVQAQYAAARAVVVPSRYEGFGFAALDALAHGKPILVSDQGALAEVVGTLGTVLPANDPTAWATAIQPLPAHDANAALARRERASSFAWATTAAAVLATWRTAAAEAKHR